MQTGSLAPKISSSRTVGADLGPWLLPIAAISALFSCAALISVVTNRVAMTLVLTAAATAAQWWVIRRVTGLNVPLGMLLVASLNAVGAFGVLFYRDIQLRANVSAPLPAEASVYRPATLIFVGASLCLFGGCLLGAAAARR